MSKMTVSRGLRAIHDLKGKLANHRAHAQASSVYFDGAKPAFEFKTELDGAEKVRADLLRLQTAIAVANATTEIEWKGKKVLVAWAIRFLEELKGEIAWVGSLPTAAQGTIKEDNFVNRIVNGTYQQVNEPRTQICELPQAEQFKRSQHLQEEFNRLNDIVETSNHQTVLKAD